MIQRQWVVSSNGAMAAWDPATMRIHTRRVHTGQTPSPTPDQLTGTDAAGIIALLGGFMLLVFAIESLPVALIAKYGFGASWGKSIALGVGSALGFNLISSALSPKPAAPVLPGPSTGSPAALPGVSATQWPVGGVPNPSGTTWNDPLMMGTGSSSGVQLGDPYSLVAPTGVQITGLTVDNPAIFKVVGSVAPTLPASVVHLTAVSKGTATFNATLSDGSTSQLATTVG
jgi:hypothetical protein